VQCRRAKNLYGVSASAEGFSGVLQAVPLLEEEKTYHWC